MGASLVLLIAVFGSLLAAPALIQWIRSGCRRLVTRRSLRRARVADEDQITPAVPLDGWRAVRELRRAAERRPIEKVAADLRRLRTEIGFDEHSSAVHQFAHRLAYDQLLTEACAMLGLGHGLSANISIGPDQELERLRTECDLESAGLVIMPGFNKAA